MKLTYLGSGNAFVPQRDWGCILVNDTILLDASPSLLVNMKRLSLDPTHIRHILLSHFHADHYFGLPFLLLEYYFLSRTAEPLAIIGPTGVERQVRQLMELAYPDVLQRGWPRPLHFVEAVPGTTQTVDGLTFSTLEMEHGHDILEAYGYRLHLPDGTLAYSGDTRMTDALYSLIDGASVAVLEATSQDESVVHLGREDLRTVLARVPTNCTVFLTHLDTPGAEPWEEFAVVVPEDLRTYDVQIPAMDSEPVIHERRV